MRLPRRIFASPLVSLSLLLAGCGGGSAESPSPTTPTPSPAVVATVAIENAPASALTIGSQVTLSAVARDAAGIPINGRSIDWNSATPAVASIDAAGVLRAIARGSTAITATVDGRSASSTVTVLGDPAALQLVRPSAVLLPRDTMSLTVRVLDAGGTVLTTAGTPTLAIDNGAVAIIAGSTLTAVTAGSVTVTAALGALRATVPVTVMVGSGERVAALSVVDSVMQVAMARMATPGFQVAIAKDGRLVFSRAYGLSDTTARRVMTTTNLLRVGSTSKPLTAAAVMRLVQDGRLRLDDRVFDLLPHVTARPGRTEDQRTAQLTVRDLLQHSQGYNVNRDVDDSVWAGVWRDGIVNQVELARIGRSARFTTNPGAGYSYNNYGYQLLGRVIERITGTSYERAVRDLILTPAGVTTMALGRTPLTSRLSDEARCYSPLGRTTSSFGTGEWCDVVPEMEYTEAAGAWVASATDMLRWLSTVDGLPGGRTEILTAATVGQMTARPSYVAATTTSWTGLCWGVLAEGSGFGLWHSGAVAGGDAYIYRRADGMTIAILGNRTRGLTASALTIDAVLLPALARITTFPSGTAF
jgi:CubicO group peptidase (beta-lactamase class C family)